MAGDRLMAGSMSFRRIVPVRLNERAEEDLLKPHEEIIGTQDHPGGTEDGCSRTLREHPGEDRELANETVEAGHRSRAQRGQDQEERKERQTLPEPAEFGHLASMVPLVDHP